MRSKDHEKFRAVIFTIGISMFVDPISHSTRNLSNVTVGSKSLLYLSQEENISGCRFLYFGAMHTATKHAEQPPH